MRRLLSQPGIPKLRALARSGQIAKKLHLKGKGHEFLDAARLLNYYQLWLDDLYPRAKFVDGLQLVEKAGHSKRMQTMRKAWIDEGKPGYATESYATKQDVDGVQNGPSEDVTKGTDTRLADTNGETASRRVTDQSTLDNDGDSEDLFFADTSKKPDENGEDTAPEDDELDALLAEQGSSHASQPKPAEHESEGEGEDDLDALLAEHESYSRASNPTVTKDGLLDEEDDVDAFQALHDASLTSLEGVEPRDAPEGEDGLDAIQAKGELKELNVADVVVGSSPFPSVSNDQDSATGT